jgi:hypothetical protein
VTREYDRPLLKGGTIAEMFAPPGDWPAPLTT